MNPALKKTLKITASAVILLVLAVAAGVGYVWYNGQYGQASMQPLPQQPKGTGGIQNTTRPKIPEDAAIGASVQSITSPVTPGSNASISVKTNPAANCTVSVIYDKTPAKDSGLAPKQADEFGIVEWTWTVQSSVPLGSWPIKVSCANKKNTAVVENDLRVVRTLE